MATSQPIPIPRQVQDISGQTFGSLLVIAYAGPDKWHNAMWSCRCDCGYVKSIRSQTLRSGRATSCGRCMTNLNDVAYQQHLRNRILDSVVLVNGGCWEWTLGRDINGYGLIKTRGKTMRAHVASHASFVGPVPHGLCVLHKCDNPPCCNPFHLFTGTSQDNSDDKCNKARQARGESCGLTKWTEDVVRQIRHSYAAGGITITDLSKRFGMSRGNVRFIVQRKTWRHIGTEPSS